MKLADAIDSEDSLAALAAMNPDEVKALGKVYSTVEDRARALGYAPKDKALGGVDLNISGLTLRTEELGKTVSRVTVTGGTISYNIDRSQLGTQLKKFIDRVAADDDNASTGTKSGSVDATRIGVGDTPVTELMVVKRGGGWYVSPTFTAAEAVAKANNLPGGSFTDLEPTKATADSPEAAAEALSRTIASADLDATVTQLSGPELLVVQSYKAAIRKLIDDNGDLADARATINDVKFKADKIDGDRSEVTIESAQGTARYTGSDGPETADFTWDGRCLKVNRSGGGDPTETCITDDARRVGADEAFVVAVKDGGKWRVSPVETALRYISNAAPKLDGNLVARLLGAPEIVDPTGTATVGSTLDAKLNDAGFAIYDLAVKANSSFTVDPENVRGGEFTSFYLVKPSGKTEYIRRGRVIEADEGGTWQLVLTTPHLKAGNVKVSIGSVLQRNISVGKPASGAIREPGQVVRYRLNTNNVKSINIELDNSELSWRLLNGFESAVRAESNGSFTIDPSKTYTIEVASKDGSTGEYMLTVTAPIDFVLGNGNTTVATGTFDAPDDVLTIDLKVRGGATVVATVSTKVASLDLTMTVIDPGGARTPYNKSGPGGSEAVRFFPTEEETFTLEVTGTGGIGDIEIKAETAPS